MEAKGSGCGAGSLGLKGAAMEEFPLVFGPVPSRRLGRSLGINNIPPKVCSYSCVYCQLGRTTRMQIRREGFYRPDEIVAAVERRLVELRGQGEEVDYITFVPDGEPTLDANLGEEITALKGMGVLVAVITNGSLLWRRDVRADLARADLVSVKVDAGTESTWKRIDRPHKCLAWACVRGGILEFRLSFKGKLISESMLVAGVNDSEEELRALAEYLRALGPDVAYISVPTRPPAETWVRPPDEGALARAYAILSDALPRVELLIGYEGESFAVSGDAARDLLSIAAVHPLREEAVAEILARDGAGWDVVEDLLRQGALVERRFGGHRFFLRRLPGRR